MCGIIGFFNFENGEELTEKGLEIIQHRGEDASNVGKGKKYCIGHCLHSINGFVEQPFDKGRFVTNCEIYNADDLDVKGRNDAEKLYNHVNEEGVSQESLRRLDGVYSFAKINDEEVILARDLLGVKPLWYYYDGNRFAFSSERKALIRNGLAKNFVKELNPRKILRFDRGSGKIKTEKRRFYELKKPYKKDEDKILQRIDTYLDKAVKKRIHDDHKIGLLFSGGVDSTYLAKKLQDYDVDFKCYVAGLKEPRLKDSRDVDKAEKAAEELGLDLEVIEINLEEVENTLPELVPLIEDNKVVKVGVALPFYLAAKQAKEDGVKIMFSGLGSEEIFAGYNRHKKSRDVNEECLSGLRKTYERDLYRDDVVCMKNNIELRLPFLDQDLVRYALTIDPSFKLKDGKTKYIFRKHAENIGVPKKFAWRKKRAAQYGSNFDKALDKLSNAEDKYKSEYVEQFYDEGNVRLGALISTGKDSLLATQIMMEQNYDIRCFITIHSKNQDSYMYHGPNTSLAEEQAETANKPLIQVNSEGEKEKELKDLKKGIKEAVEQHNIEGIVTGAIYSTYQRDRVEKICEDLGIKCFSPLWHLDQEDEVRMLEKKNFEWIMVKIAAQGLDKDWLAKLITEEDIDTLATLNDDIGFNIAGEGGEYESFVTYAPFFDEKIKIDDYEIREESEIEATMQIKKIR